MSKISLSELSRKMARIDFTMLATKSADGTMTARPMSTNREVGDNGDSWFFTDKGSRKVADIRADRHVTLSFTGAAGLSGGPPVFIAVEGEASLIEDRAAFADHWTKDAEYYFPDGIDTPGLVMIRVAASSVRYWDGDDQGEISV
jgi:general stress protein 26